MNDRDHFAAAALTGLLAGKEHNRDIDGADHTATAYYIADAMLRERDRRVTEPMPKEKRAEVSDRLTDAEREAITEASEFYIGTRTGVALRGLLERTR